MNNIRNSKFEMLRIISMFLIVMCHMFLIPVQSDNGSIIQTFHNSQSNLLIAESFGIFGRLGNNLFVLISGYFLINKNVDVISSVRRILKISISVSSWALIFFIISTVVLGFNPLLMIKSMFPIIFSLYWFVTPFVVLILIAPFLNQIISTITKKDSYYLLSICILVTSLIPTFTHQIRSKVGFTDIGIFITLYLSAGLIKKYNLGSGFSKKALVASASISMMLQIFNIYTIGYLAGKLQHFNLLSNIVYFNGQASILLYIPAIAIFLLVIKMNDFYSIIINRIASTAFGVYLIHQNPFIIEWIFRSNWIKSFIDFNAYSYVFSILCIVIVVYLTCSLLEFIRQKLFTQIKFDSYERKVSNFVNQIFLKF